MKYSIHKNYTVLFIPHKVKIFSQVSAEVNDMHGCSGCCLELQVHLHITESTDSLHSENRETGICVRFGNVSLHAVEPKGTELAYGSV